MKYNHCLGHTQRQCRNVRNATVRLGEPQDHREEGPEKKGLQHTTTTLGREAIRDHPMPSSSDDHSRQPTTDMDVIDQSIVMASGTARVSDERTDQGVLSVNQEEGISAEEQARRRLRSKQPARRSLNFEATETRGDDCCDQTRDFQNCCREARFGTGTQIFVQASVH